MLNINLEEETIKNDNFRKVIKTTKNMQLVLMSLKPKEIINTEIHFDSDQFFRIEEGKCKIETPSETLILSKNMSTIIPMGTQHKVTNIGDTDLKLYTIYSLPQHADGLIQKYMAEEQSGGYNIDKYLEYVDNLLNKFNF